MGSVVSVSVNNLARQARLIQFLSPVIGVGVDQEMTLNLIHDHSTAAMIMSQMCQTNLCQSTHILNIKTITKSYEQNELFLYRIITS